MSRQILIVGYHRSGTSAMAQNCHAASMFLGENLLAASTTNIYGHFEDTDFVSINQALLQLNYEGWYLSSEFVPVIPRKMRTVASDMIAKRDAEYEFWGFKDPRVCVLLDFWNSVLPDPRYLICLRHYRGCIESVVRRGLKDVYGARERAAAILAAEAFNHDAICMNWCVYMSNVLRLLRHHSDKCIAIEVERLDPSFSLSSLMNQRFDIDLTPITIGQTFDPSIYKKATKSTVDVSPWLLEYAERLWGELCLYSTDAETLKASA